MVQFDYYLPREVAGISKGGGGCEPYTKLYSLEQGRIQTVAYDLHKSLNFFIDKANMERNIEKLLKIYSIMIDFSL